MADGDSKRTAPIETVVDDIGKRVIELEPPGVKLPATPPIVREYKDRKGTVHIIPESLLACQDDYRLPLHEIFKRMDKFKHDYPIHTTDFGVRGKTKSTAIRITKTNAVEKWAKLNCMDIMRDEIITVMGRMFVHIYAVCGKDMNSYLHKNAASIVSIYFRVSRKVSKAFHLKHQGALVRDSKKYKSTAELRLDNAKRMLTKDFDDYWESGVPLVQQCFKCTNRVSLGKKLIYCPCGEAAYCSHECRKNDWGMPKSMIGTDKAPRSKPLGENDDSDLEPEDPEYDAIPKYGNHREECVMTDADEVTLTKVNRLWTKVKKRQDIEQDELYQKATLEEQKLEDERRAKVAANKPPPPPPVVLSVTESKDIATEPAKPALAEVAIGETGLETNDVEHPEWKAANDKAVMEAKLIKISVDMTPEQVSLAIKNNEPILKEHTDKVLSIDSKLVLESKGVSIPTPLTPLVVTPLPIIPMASSFDPTAYRIDVEVPGITEMHKHIFEMKCEITSSIVTYRGQDVLLGHMIYTVNLRSRANKAALMGKHVYYVNPSMKEYNGKPIVAWSADDAKRYSDQVRILNTEAMRTAPAGLIRSGQAPHKPIILKNLEDEFNEWLKDFESVAGEKRITLKGRIDNQIVDILEVDIIKDGTTRKMYFRSATAKEKIADRRKRAEDKRKGISKPPAAASGVPVSGISSPSITTVDDGAGGERPRATQEEVKEMIARGEVPGMSSKCPLVVSNSDEVYSVAKSLDRRISKEIQPSEVEGLPGVLKFITFPIRSSRDSMDVCMVMFFKIDSHISSKPLIDIGKPAAPPS